MKCIPFFREWMILFFLMLTFSVLNASGDKKALASAAHGNKVNRGLHTVGIPQAPSISYSTPQAFTTGTTITTITPINNGGSVPQTVYGQMTTIAGTAGKPGAVNGTGTAASFSYPIEIAIDAAGNLYVIDSGNVLIRKITPSGVVTTFAGSGSYGAQDGPGATASFSNPNGITTDAQGNVYVSDVSNQSIRKITPDGMVSTLAGKSGVAGAANGLGTAATFSNPLGMAVDNNDNIYVADYNNYLIRKITPAGLVSTFAGQAGVAGATNGTTASATFKPTACTVDQQGNVYIADGGNNLVRKIAVDGSVSTLAGNGTQGSTDGVGTAASFYQPNLIVLDAIGNLYVSDEGNNTIRKITPDGVVTTIAGVAGLHGYNDGIGLDGKFYGAAGLAMDDAGNIYFSDLINHVIRKLTTTGYKIDKPLPTGLIFDSTTGTISGTPAVLSPATTYTITAYNTGGSSTTTIAIGVTGTMNFDTIPPKIYGSADFSPAASTAGLVTYTSSNQAVATIVAGKIHILSAGISTITATNGSTTLTQKLTVAPALLTLIADNKSRVYNAANPALTFTASGFVNGDALTNLTAQPIINTSALTISQPGNYPITVSAAADPNYTINYITGTLTVLGGNTTITAPIISYSSPHAYSIGAAISPLQPANTGGLVPATIYAQVTTLAGTPGVQGSTNGTGTTATFNQPYGIVADAAGNVFVAEQVNNLIRKITPAGIVSTFAGSGAAGAANGTGTAASFNFPTGLAIDSTGNLYVADEMDGLIRKITAGGVVSTIAGGGVAMEGQGNQVNFSGPRSIAIDKSGNLYVADTYNILVKKITPSGLVTIFAGQKGVQTSVDGQGAAATFYEPSGLATDEAGNIYVADNNKIRKITPGGLVSTLAGSDSYGSKDGLGVAASFELPQALTADAAGNVYVADQGDNIIRKITPGGLVLTIAGNRSVFGPTDGIGTNATFYFPSGITMDATGNLYISDQYVIRKISTTGYAIDKPLPPALAFDAKTGIITGTPTAASPATDYTITAHNVSGASTSIVNLKTYADVSLTKLTISNGTLSPQFTGNNTTYTVSVDHSVTAITVTPTAMDPNAIVKVNQTKVPSGSASAQIPLSIGDNIVTVLVTSPDSSVNQSYTITVTKVASTDATLASLSISNGTFNPAFSSSATNYAVSVGNAVSSVTVTPVVNEPDATLTVNGIALASGSASTAIPLSVGDNSINIKVVAQDGKTIYTYSISVNRAYSPDANLANLTISSGILTPIFVPGTNNYTASVDNSVSALTVTPTAEESHATIQVNGMASPTGSASSSIPLRVGIDTIKIMVQAQDNSLRLYTIAVSRAPSANASLAGLAISTGTLSPAFSSGTTFYNTSVAYVDSTLSVTPMLTDSNATMVINGAAIKSGAASTPLVLAIGNNNTIAVTVTAQDGTTTKTYSINVARAIPAIFTLPQNNFQLKITGATCKGSNNGSLNITAAQNLNYTATITGNGLNAAYPFTTLQTINNLPAGKYSVCIVVDGQNGYQQCDDVEITEPKDLALYTTINAADNTVSLALSGGTQYNINLNGINYTTTNSSITLPLKKGTNDFTVTTDKLCQGAIEKQINFLAKIVPYPNPFQNNISLDLGSSIVNNVSVEIYNLSFSKIYFSKQYGYISGALQLDLSSLPNGVYALKLTSDNSENIFKILKQ